MLHRTLLVAGLAGALAAQTPPCISLNDANTSVGTAITAFGFGGPGVNAYQFIPTTTIVLQAAQIYTASMPFSSPRGYQTLEIWDNNFIGLPQTRLGGGTWQNQPTSPLAPAWQGASFDALVVLQANQVYWLVWRESGSNLLPYEPGGVQAVMARFTGGQWQLQANGAAIKWRGFCTLLDAFDVQAVGYGCAATTGRIPSAFTNNAPTIGNADFQFEASGFTAGTIGLVVLGINPAFVPVPLPIAQPGCIVYADPQVLLTLAVGTGNEQALHSTGCAGHCWSEGPIPSNPALAGIVVDAQFGAIDFGSTAPLPLVLTNGVRVTLY